MGLHSMTRNIGNNIFGCMPTRVRRSFNNEGYALSIPVGFKNYNVVHLEILNIVVALRIWVKYGRIKN